MSDPEIIYGRNPVEEAKRGRRKVLRVWEAPETPETRLVELCGSTDHQGIVAEVEPFPYLSGSDLLAGEDALVVVLDQIQDPRNLGAICRSAEAAGATGVVIPDRRAASVTAAAAKASAGAVEHLKIARVRNISDWIIEAKDAGFWIWGADGRADQAPWQVDLTGKTALVLGTEEKGLRQRVADSCDGLIAIPQSGQVDSLNVSVAAAVLIFEAIRQRSRT
ncbi:MAG TPA: 23S rRNA (guanosine(2251)-2'-O)-methyltransferase RlmB [Solirubrobacterales bacterium]|jgi:23S rRNA (guanosine2251-2'-O)-methyltransferase|nr:23S rRNA (guanosine(2251)-2'-O)-methyltransferase RlmB [Solirubrobacterales bacterium]HMU27838.1 23S rRNA (guanosine(2251)-2'-O)-methyltransferase RlmB [Solirubrobacterales bacterium]HMW44260.1 23S rRNA (guanosine(2251)-2'-O)-methyltransferase RlmB [Solirubrobacterales bacterium]HMX70315.1 23S rRNA (guanosine(2251)-2'-O)-methyltransferase RlmB [Solirubrobacterales bacterium]HMY25827.1 23S rRNA (guanosine(2251)-2'-O)-methyltransferase RlmB [Solirubrobacterales bacterium]